MKHQCKIFANCAKIMQLNGYADHKYLYALINTYNNYASKELAISDSEKYSDDQLAEIAKRLTDFISSHSKEQIESKLKAFEEMLSGGKSAIANVSLAHSNIPADKINDVLMDFSRVFVTVVTNTLQGSRNNSFSSVKDYLHSKPENIRSVLKIVYSYYNLLYKLNLELLNGKSVEDVKNLYSTSKLIRFMDHPIKGDPENGVPEIKSIFDRSQEEVEESLSLLKAIGFGTDNAQNMIKYIFSNSLPFINDYFQTRIKSTFDVENLSIIEDDEFIEIEEEENKIQERWNSNPDTKDIEGSISPIISTLLLRVLPITNTVTPTYKDGDAYFVHRSEYKTTSISGLPSFQKPAVVARKLYKLLHGCISEEVMMKRLEAAGPAYYEIIKVLNSDPAIKTTFWQEFNKYFIEFKEISVSQNPDGSQDANAPELNVGGKRDLIDTYLRRLRRDSSVENSSSNGFIVGKKNEVNPEIYDIRVNPRRFDAAVKYVEKYISFDDDATAATLKEDLSSNGKYLFIQRLCSFFNISPSDDEIDVICGNDSNFSNFITAVASIINKKFQTKFINGSSIKSFEEIISNNKAYRAAMENILLLTTPGVNQKYSSNITWEKSSLSSYILNSSYSMFINNVNELDGDELEAYFDRRYGSKGYGQNYVESDGIRPARYLNRYVNDFLLAAKAGRLSGLNKTFGITRDLGINKVPFEKIDKAEHMLMFLYEYLNHRNYDNQYTYHSDESSINKNAKQTQILEGTPFAYENGIQVDRNDYAVIPSFITGDNNSLRSFKALHYSFNEILSGMYDLYLSDLSNININREFNNKGLVLYANNKEAFTNKLDTFGILSFLNDSVPSDVLSSYFGIDSSSNFKWKDLISSDGSGIFSRDDFNNVVSAYLNSEFDNFIDKIRDLGLLDFTEDGKSLYFDKWAGKDIDTKESNILSHLKDFFFDYKFGQYCQLQISHITPLFFNGVEDLQKRNKVPLTNGYALSKDAKFVDIDGKVHNVWEEGKFYQTVVYFNDIEVKMNDDNYAALRENAYKYYYNLSNNKEFANKKANEYMKRYDSNSLTDGQSFRTLDSYRKILISAGKSFWTNEHESAYRMIKNILEQVGNNELSMDQIGIIDNCLAKFTAVKPVNDGIEDYSGTKISFQFKYAEVPLIPQMMPKGSKLREIGEWMENNGVDLIASTRCMKKGCFGQADFLYKLNEDGQYVNKNNEIIPGYDAENKLVKNPTLGQQQRYITVSKIDNRVYNDDSTSFDDIMSKQKFVEDGGRYVVKHQIPLDGYLIQNRISDHTNGQMNLGTQGRKIISGAIIRDDSVIYNIGQFTKGLDGSYSKQTIGGNKLFNLYSALHAAKYANSFRKFNSKISDDTSFIKDVIETYLNSNRSNLALVERIRLNKNGDPNIPFSELTCAQDLYPSVISTFKKMVVRQMIQGGMLVQMSALGIGKSISDPDLHSVRDKDGNITGYEIEKPFDYFYYDESGNKIDLEYDEWCNTDGTFKEGEILSEDDPRYEDYKVWVNNDGDVFIPLIEQYFPGILIDTMYRVPTEEAYSMYRTLTKRCNPKSSCRCTRKPAEFTSETDSDFDIDEDYRFSKSYKVAKGNTPSELDVWNSIYDYYTVNNGHPVLYNGTSMDLIEALKLIKELDKKNNPKFDEKKKLHEYYTDNIHQLFIPKYSDANFEWSRENKLNKSDLYKLFKSELEIGSFKNGTYGIESGSIDFNMDISDIGKLSDQQIDNAICDIANAVLSHQSTMFDRFAGGGFPQTERAAVAIRIMKNKTLMSNIIDGNKVDFEKLEKEIDNGAPKERWDYSDPFTAIEFKSRNQIAGTLIGVFANQNINNAISRSLSKFESSYPILFGSLLGEINELDGVTENIDKSKLGRSFLFNTINGSTIKKNLAELLAASVDAVKNPCLNYLNLNVTTADFAATLIRLGYNIQDVGILLNQPIILEMCSYMNKYKISNINSALSYILRNNYGVKNTASIFGKRVQIDNSKLTSDVLISNLTAANSDSLTKSQLEVAKLFYRLAKVKSELSNFVKMTRNTSANTIKARFEDQIADSLTPSTFNVLSIEDTNGNFPMKLDMKLEDLTDKKAMCEYFKKNTNHPFLYEQVLYNIIDLSFDIMKDKFTLYNTQRYKEYVNELSNIITTYRVNGDTLEKLFRYIPQSEALKHAGDLNPLFKSPDVEDEYVNNAHKYLIGTINTLMEIQKRLSKYDEYSDEDFAKMTEGQINEYNQILEDQQKLSSNVFMEKLDAKSINNMDENSHAILEFAYSKGMSNREKFELAVAWRELYEMGGIYKKFAKELALHFYMSSGIVPFVNHSINVLPIELFNDIVLDYDQDLKFSDLFRKELYETASDNEGLASIIKDIYKFISQNVDDGKLVVNTPYKLNDLQITDSKGNALENVITFSGDKFDSVVLSKTRTSVTVAPFIKVQGRPFVLVRSGSSSDNVEVDYNNTKSSNLKTAYYAPLEIMNNEEFSKEDDLGLSQFASLNSGSRAIYGVIKDESSLFSSNNPDEIIITDEEEDDDTNSSYDKTKDETKDEKVVNHEGIESC